MPATHGLLKLPVQVPGPDDTPGDPALDVLVAYWKAFLLAYGNAAWQAVAANEPVVRKAFVGDPQERNFNDNDLPALFLFREGSNTRPDDIADEYRLSFDTLVLFWVLPPSQQEKQVRRYQYGNAIAKMIDRAVEKNRDPSFVLNPSTATPKELAEGTTILQAVDGWRLDLVSWRRTNLVINMFVGDGEPCVYQAIEMRFDFQERVQDDILAISSPAKLALDVLVRRCPGLPESVNGEPVPLEDFLASSAVFNGAFSSAFSHDFDGCDPISQFSSAFSPEFQV